MFREQARKRLTKKAKKGFRGFPVATVAFYGPDNRRASKVTVGIVLAENQEAVELKRWFADPGDVREDVRVAEEVLAYMEGLACARLRWWTGSLAARTRKGSTTRDRPVPCAPTGLGAIAGAGKGSIKQTVGGTLWRPGAYTCILHGPRLNFDDFCRAEY